MEIRCRRLVPFAFSWLLACGGGPGDPDAGSSVDAAPRCGDGVCGAGENGSTCPEDCEPGCGDGTCAEGESAESCPADCEAPTPSCGDLVCGEGEDASNCPADCEPTGPGCGDSTCDADESLASCPRDCAPPSAVIVANALRLPEEDPNFVRATVEADRLILVFEPAPQITFHVGDLVAGTTEPGYLRRITTLEVSGGTVTLGTRQAALAEAIREGDARIAIEDPMPMSLRHSFPFEEEITAVDDLTLTASGSIDVQVLGHVDLSFGAFSVRRAEVRLDPSVTVRLDLDVGSSAMLEASDEIDLLETAPSARFYAQIGPLPVVGRVEVGFVLGYRVAAMGTATIGLGRTVIADGSIGMRYDEGAWTPIRSFTSDSPDGLEPTGTFEASLGARAYVRPEVRVLFYGVGGPVASVERAIDFEATATATAGCVDWEMHDVTATDASLRLDVAVPILGRFSESYRLLREEERSLIDDGTLGPCPCLAREGEPCCAGGECFDTGGPEPLACGPEGVCRRGVVGASCADDSQCTSTMTSPHCFGGICTTGGWGDACVTDADCAGDGLCGPGGICRAGGFQQPCEDVGDCGYGLVCGFGSICRYGAAGEPCTSDAHCDPGVCNARGTCTEEPACSTSLCPDPDLYGCDPDTFRCRPTCPPTGCGSGYCAGGLCLDGDGGEQCSTDAQCRTGRCNDLGVCHGRGRVLDCVGDADCDGDLCGPTGTCQVGTLGDRCDGPDDCDADHYCVDGYCRSGHVGQACVDDGDCLSVYLCGPDGICRHGRPGDPCVDASDCNPSRTGFVCTGFGTCGTGAEGQPCSDDSHCAGTLVCGDAGTCAMP